MPFFHAKTRILWCLVLLLPAAVHALHSGPQLDDWDEAKVAEWVASLGDAFKPYAEKFHEHAIDGKIFGTLDDVGLKDIGVDKSFHRKFILKQVKASKDLSPDFHNPNPNDFYEYRAANRKKTDTMMQMSIMSPRLLMLYGWFYDRPLMEKVTGWTNGMGTDVIAGMLFVPHLQMAYYAYPYAEQYGWPAWSFIIANVLASLTEWLLLLGMHPIFVRKAVEYGIMEHLTFGYGQAHIRAHMEQLKATIITLAPGLGHHIFRVVIRVILVGIGWLVYPIMPWFLCDFSAYLFLYCQGIFSLWNTFISEENKIWPILWDRPFA